MTAIKEFYLSVGDIFQSTDGRIITITNIEEDCKLLEKDKEFFDNDGFCILCRCENIHSGYPYLVYGFRFMDKIWKRISEGTGLRVNIYTPSDNQSFSTYLKNVKNPMLEYVNQEYKEILKIKTIQIKKLSINSNEEQLSLF